MAPPFTSSHPHKRNLSIQKLISASTLMAPTHDRVVGLDPDEVKTPISGASPALGLDGDLALREKAAGTSVTEAGRESEQSNGKVEDVGLGLNMKGPQGQTTAEKDTERKVDEEIQSHQEDARKAQAKAFGAAPAHADSGPTSKTEPAAGSGQKGAKEEIKYITHKVKSLASTTSSTRSPYFRLSDELRRHLYRVFVDNCSAANPAASTTPAGTPSATPRVGVEEKGKQDAPTMSLADFTSFVKNVQQSPLILKKLEGNELGTVKDGVEKQWGFEEWLSFMAREGGLEGVRNVGTGGVVVEGGRKGEKEEKGVLSHPITSYFVDSSHNTYLMGNQWFSKSDTDAYRYVSSSFLGM